MRFKIKVQRRETHLSWLVQEMMCKMHLYEF